MLCLVAWIVFGILGIFSVKYRRWAKESVDCVFRRVTFRPCTTNFDDELKAKVSGKLFHYSPRLAGFVHKRFEVLSWIFIILMVLSIFFSAQSAYNLAVHGNCNGPDADPGSCVLRLTVEQACACADKACVKDKDCDKGCLCEDNKCKQAKGIASLISFIKHRL